MNSATPTELAFDLARADLAALDPRALKRLRKDIRKLILKDVQRRAITGEPSPFRRCTQP